MVPRFLCERWRGWGGPVYHCGISPHPGWYEKPAASGTHGEQRRAAHSTARRAPRRSTRSMRPAPAPATDPNPCGSCRPCAREEGTSRTSLVAERRSVLCDGSVRAHRTARASHSARAAAAELLDCRERWCAQAHVRGWGRGGAPLPSSPRGYVAHAQPASYAIGPSCEPRSDPASHTYYAGAYELQREPSARLSLLEIMRTKLCVRAER